MAGGGGHGGAWKVAFADFMTAMMALFLVLWISAQDKEILIATSKYFQQPFNSPMDASSGVLSMEGSSSAAEQINDSDSSSLTDLSLLNKLAQDFYKMLEIDGNSADAPVEVEVTNDGLRVTVFNRAEHAVFVDDTAEFTEWGRFLVENVAWLIARNKFKIRVDGYTTGGFTSPRPDYTAWELSADRANAMRRGLQYFAVPADKFERVTGFGDTVPLDRTDLTSRANERVEISLVILPPLGPPPLASATRTESAAGSTPATAAPH
jgi:chemotaxis protein MotB